MFLRKIRNSRTTRIISFFMAINILAEIISPNVAMALTSGPSQPEVQSFEPVNTSEMVDLFSGDFKYNIPLMDVGGYPLNINYNSGIGMDQEASWVGLGWNLNVGAINRNMRGLPDDFNGQDKITKEFNMKDNVTYGTSVKLGIEVFGIGKNNNNNNNNNSLNVSVGIGINYNNYTGVGVEQTRNMALSAGSSGKGKMNASLGMSSSASEGLSINHSVSFSCMIDGKNKAENSETKVSAGAAMGVNSRSGLKNLSLNTNLQRSAVFKNDGKKYSESGSVGSSGTVNFGVSTYVPNIQFPMVNNSVATNFKLGFTVFGTDGSVDMSGYYSNQKLATKSLTLPAYGYLYSHDGQGNDNALMDFNREKDGGYNRNMQRLPITNFTYDVYSVAGQGVGGTYRPFRHDIGYVFDNEANTTSDSYTLGGEVDAAQTFHAGVDISVVDVNTNTGKWSGQNNAAPKLSYKGSTSSIDEPYAFKEVGEKSVDSDPTMFTAFGGFSPVRVQLTGAAMAVKADANFERQNASGNISAIGIPTNKRQNRHKRNQLISTMSMGEAKQFGLDKKYYDSSDPSNILPKDFSNNILSKDHHIAEISVLRTDGSKYVYGLPAYNKRQEEVTFNISGSSQSNSDVANGLISYSAADASTGNKKGIDNYYNKVITPAYVHAYMLTGVVSPDYVDVTGNGLTDDDLGNYTKFEYDKVSNYKWRTPVGDVPYKANYNENTKAASPQDDYGSYVYGYKDLFFVKKIETKNYIAIFATEDRYDASGVDETGAPITSQHSKLLKSITLYSKPDYQQQLASPTTHTAVPIKVVHFVYNYDLCPNVPNHTYTGTTLSGDYYYTGTNAKGKLTLKQVYFTYGSSDKAKFNTYTFNYSSNNPSYDPKAYDRWGNYKPNPAAGISGASSAVTAIGSVLPNWEYPYVEQNSQTNADNYSSAWSLSQITLPSGADINIEYESDDYAYVQNLPSMNMCKVVKLVPSSQSISDDSGFNTTPHLENLMTGTPGSSNDKLIFKLPKTLSSSQIGSDQTKYFKEHILKDIFSGRFMYFRFLVNMTKQTGAFNQNVGNYFEYVSGYAELDNSSSSKFGFIPSAVNGGTYDYAYVTVKTVPVGKINNTPVHPIAKAAWQMGRVHFPNLVWDASFQPNGGPIDVIKSIANSSFAKNIIDGIKGPNLAIATKGYGMESVMNKSWIRLYEPTGKKLGGGCRVKTLTINDNWDNMTDNGSGGHQKDFTYGQSYEYTTQENGQTISSGVAAYEPMIGGDEIPFRLPNYYTNQGNNPAALNFLIPSDEFFQEEPYGESFFPSPSVGYSKVKVSNIKRTDNATPTPNRIVKAHATGWVIHKFYTAKDYPTYVDRTNISKKSFKPPFAGLTKILARDFLTVTQGHVIELNDMHGKARGQEVYAEDKPGTPISTIEYRYQTQGTNGYEEPSTGNMLQNAALKANRLNNTCNVINPNGTVNNNAQIGVDYDMVADFRESKTTTVIGGAQINLSGFLVGVFPGLVPTIWPDFSRDVTRFRSAVTTKVISRYGILEKTIATDLGSKVETSNLAYDSETGEVLLTKTYNDFEDQIYSFTFPAHWSYDRMGQAYKNIGTYANGVVFNGSSPSSTISNAKDLFVEGDEISLNNTTKAWICTVNANSIQAIDASGSPVSGTYNIKVLRSGRRNQQSLPIGSVVSLTNPIVTGTLSFGSSSSNSKVIKTGAVEYAEQWKMYPGYTETNGSSCNCSITQYGIDMSTLISDLISNLSFVNVSPVRLYSNASGGIYYHSFTPLLNNSLLNHNTQQYWKTYSVSGNVAQFNIAPEGDTTRSACNTIVATLPGGTDWNSVSINRVTSASLVTNTTTCSASLVICADNTFNANPPVCFTVTTSDVCWPLSSCSSTPSSTVVCGPNVNDVVNPYLVGIKGNWRMLKSWSYLSDRNQTLAGTNSTNTDIRYDGVLVTKNPSNGSLEAFSPFWQWNSGTGRFSENNQRWTFTSQVTQYNPYGFELENKDALNRYSSAIYGYNMSLPIAVGSNAQLQEIAYDGFEDYDFINSSDCRKNHFNFYENKTKRVAYEAHTGLYSMMVTPGSSVSTKRKLPIACTPYIAPNCAYSLSCSDFIPLFSPNAQKYVLSYWVKEKSNSMVSVLLNRPPVLSYTSSNVTVSIGGSAATLSNVVKSAIIDGWQRVECTFTVPSGSSGDIVVSLNNPSYIINGVTSYFDDIRIHPFNSNMKSFVYHPVTLKYIAELDANNFATFYEYDEEGSLIRVKKETEKGIMTIQETKNHTKR